MSLWDHSLRELIEKGGLLMWPLLACSVISLALVLDRSCAFLLRRLEFRRFARELRARLLGAPAGQGLDAASALESCKASRSPIAHVAEAYLRQIGSPAELREKVVEREGSLALEALERRLRGLASIAQVATLLGLLGTVAGLVGAFRQIELHAGQVDPERLASGIWEALLTTVFGLVVAIPSFLAHHFFDAGVERTETRMSAIVSYLDEWVADARTPSASSERAETPDAGTSAPRKAGVMGSIR